MAAENGQRQRRPHSLILQPERATHTPQRRLGSSARCVPLNTKKWGKKFQKICRKSHHGAILLAADLLPPALVRNASAGRAGVVPARHEPWRDMEGYQRRRLPRRGPHGPRGRRRRRRRRRRPRWSRPPRGIAPPGQGLVLCAAPRCPIGAAWPRRLRARTIRATRRRPCESGPSCRDHAWMGPVCRASDPPGVRPPRPDEAPPPFPPPVPARAQAAALLEGMSQDQGTAVLGAIKGIDPTKARRPGRQASRKRAGGGGGAGGSPISKDRGCDVLGRAACRARRSRGRARVTAGGTRASRASPAPARPAPPP